MDLKLQGKNAIVTGASRGVGRAIALGLASEGVNLALCASTEEGVAKTAEDARKFGVDVYTFAADLGDATSTLAMMKGAHQALKTLDILINNAGIWLTGWCQNIPLEDWQRTLDVNLTGPFLTSQYFAKVNLEAKRPGKIINVNSQAAFNGSTTGHAHYAASKAGMTAMTISMARELSPHGITVNGIALGIVATDMTKDAIANRPGYYEGRIPLGRVAEPEDIANIVVFMASEPAGYLTGTTVDATGGMLMR